MIVQFVQMLHVPWICCSYCECIVDHHDTVEQMCLLWFDCELHQTRNGNATPIQKTYIFQYVYWQPEMDRHRWKYAKVLKVDRSPRHCLTYFSLENQGIYRLHEETSIFGSVITCVCFVEFKERLLLYMHLLLTCDREVMRDANEVDKYIFVDISNKGHTLLHETTFNCNSHICCTSCDNNQECSKGFSKSFPDSSWIECNSYPLNRKRDDGRFVMKLGQKITNQHVVSYNPISSRKFDAHINGLR